MSSKWKIHKRKKVAREDLIRDFNYSGIELEENGLDDDIPTMDAGIEAMGGDIDFTQDYDTKPAFNIDADETQILYGESLEDEVVENPDAPAVEKEVPYDPKKVIKHKIPNIGKSVKNFQRKKSGQNFRKILLELIDFVPNTINYCVEYAMYHYCYYAFKDTKNWPQYEEAHADACATIMKLVTVPIAAIVVLNWWYLLNYTDFYIDTDQIFKKFPLSAFETMLEPTAIIIGTINNNLMGKRVFASTSESDRKIYNKLWEYRPITISVFFMLVYTLLVGVDVNDVLRSAILGNPNPIFYSITGISILLYLFIFMNKTFKDWMITYKTVILVGILFLLCLIGVILFSYLGVFIVFYYVIFFSVFFIFVYTYFNLSKIGDIATTILNDLVFSKPLFNDKGSLPKKIANELIRHSFPLLINGAMPFIGLYGYNSTIVKLGAKFDFPTNMMRLFYSGFIIYGIRKFYYVFKSSMKDIKVLIQKARDAYNLENDTGFIPESTGESNAFPPIPDITTNNAPPISQYAPPPPIPGIPMNYTQNTMDNSNYNQVITDDSNYRYNAGEFNY